MTLVYNDAPFLGEAVLASYGGDMVHPRVLMEWAKCVGVGSLRRLMLSDKKTTQVGGPLPAPHRIHTLFGRSSSVCVSG